MTLAWLRAFAVAVLALHVAAAAPPALAPAALAAPPAVAATAALVAPAAVAVQALAVAASTYEAQNRAEQQQITRARLDASAQRVERAHEVSEQVHQQVEVAQLANLRAMREQLRRNGAAAVRPRVAPPVLAAQPEALEDIDRELNDGVTQILERTKELGVQTRLAQEKQDAVRQATSQYTDLKRRAEDARREADVATKIAREKEDEAREVQKEEDVADDKLKQLSAEAAETGKFLAQTRQEVQILTERNADLKARRSELAAEAAQKKAAAAAAALKAAPSVTGTAAVPPPAAAPAQPEVVAAAAAMLKATAAAAASLPTPAVIAGPVQPSTATPAVDPQVLQRLLSENARLRAEKAELARQLRDAHSNPEVAQLKAGLKKKLKLLDKVESRPKAFAVPEKH